MAEQEPRVPKGLPVRQELLAVPSDRPEKLEPLERQTDPPESQAAQARQECQEPLARLVSREYKGLQALREIQVPHL